MIFLATPHRGAQYAKILTNILSAAPLGAPPKTYTTDLEAHSTALQDINEQFRTICGDLALVFFFETLKTSFGVTKLLVRHTITSMHASAGCFRLLRKSLAFLDTPKRCQVH